MNMDPVMHDIQAYETSHLGPRVLFNTPLPMNPHHKRNVGCRDSRASGRPADDESRSSMTKGRQIFRHAMRISCLYGKLGAWPWTIRIIN